jgi:hypothetical protein
VELAQQVKAGRDVRVVVSQQLSSHLEGPFEQGSSLVVVAELPVGVTDRRQEPGAHEGLVLELPVEAPCAPVENVPHRHGRPEVAPGVEVLEDPHQELRDLTRVLGLPLRSEQPDAGAGNRHHESDDDHCGGRHPHPVPPHELPYPVCRARGAGQDRLVAQVPLEVRPQLRRGAVASGAVLLQRLHRDPVQIAPQDPGQGREVGPAVPGGGLRDVTHAAELGAGPGGLLFADRASKLVEAELS